mmetsp:Transcript_25131/g.59049  ORF Transcript_25131/g.59049 Transcript_25131/m.59049 type:complete len:214 (-) Transcript_25131:369-1010(-)
MLFWPLVNQSLDSRNLSPKLTEFVAQNSPMSCSRAASVHDALTLPAAIPRKSTAASRILSPPVIRGTTLTPASMPSYARRISSILSCFSMMTAQTSGSMSCTGTRSSCVTLNPSWLPPEQSQRHMAESILWKSKKLPLEVNSSTCLGLLSEVDQPPTREAATRNDDCTRTSLPISGGKLSVTSCISTVQLNRRKDALVNTPVRKGVSPGRMLP